MATLKIKMSLNELIDYISRYNHEYYKFNKEKKNIEYTYMCNL